MSTIHSINKTNEPEQFAGKLRVGRRKYIGKTFTEPSFEGFAPVIVMIKDDPKKGEYGLLSPYNIRTQPTVEFPNGVLIENYWQFLKVYQEIKPIKVPYSTNDPQIVWTHEGGVHIDKSDKVTPEWDLWRRQGFATQLPVRFPVGSNPRDRAKCKFALTIEDDGTIDTTKRLDYVQSRKATYGKVFCENVKLHPLFAELQERLRQGENLLIIEVDGPHQESLNYYMTQYGVNNNFIQNSTTEVTVQNMKLLINDTKHPFGHGYCLAVELLGIRDKVCS